MVQLRTDVQKPTFVRNVTTVFVTKQPCSFQPFFLIPTAVTLRNVQKCVHTWLYGLPGCNYKQISHVAKKYFILSTLDGKREGPPWWRLLILFQMHCSGLAWHPDVATQMVLASEDDRLPVIQVWDLRFASSPLRVLESHARCVGFPLGNFTWGWVGDGGIWDRK